MSSPENGRSRRISVDLPEELIKWFDELKGEWGLRRRGAVLERLLEEIFEEKLTAANNINKNENVDFTSKEVNSTKDESSTPINNYIEDSAIILINSDDKTENQESNISYSEINENRENTNKGNTKTKEIDLPGFVSKRTERLKNSLRSISKSDTNYDAIVHGINEENIDKCINTALRHWISLYGHKPKEEVLEASMIWMARDIWPHLDDTQNLPFTWNAAKSFMSKLCPSWKGSNPSFERIIVMAGVLEDPFATKNLNNRVPTLIRRFVNSFKRQSNVTSFQTLESTMTVHGALKLLGIPTTAGKSISLSTVRDAYKSKALDNHPDSGGSTEMMRRINEAYQLLKDLYKRKN